MRRTICLALLAACGGAPGAPATLQFSENALMQVQGTKGQLQVTVRSSPQPPGLGLINFQYTVTNMMNEPVDGLQLDVLPWMPAMGHGAPITPTVTDQGGGVYLITNVDFFMQGEWQLRTTITGSVSDSVGPIFQVQ